MKKHVNIPIFLPQYGCANDCIFCNQKTITGKKGNPTLLEVRDTIDLRLKTIKKEETEVQIAFFGGNFLGLPQSQQKDYLSVAQEYIDFGFVNSIRFSTRPDSISENSLNYIKAFSVKNIELGMQSMDDEVLLKAGRGHTAIETVEASKLILEKGYVLGLQMMLGLPGDNFEKLMQTAKYIVDLGASETRIYPVLILKDTHLEELYRRGLFQSLSIEESVEMVAKLVHFFKENNIKILKVGLHPSEAYTSENELVAGPYHPSFYELVLTQIWKDRLGKKLKTFNKEENILIRANKFEINSIVGHKSSNKIWLKENYPNAIIKLDESLIKGEFVIEKI